MLFFLLNNQNRCFWFWMFQTLCLLFHLWYHHWLVNWECRQELWSLTIWPFSIPWRLVIIQGSVVFSMWLMLALADVKLSWLFIVKKSCYCGRRIDCNTVSKFRNIGINTFLGLRFLNGMMQGIDTFSEFFEISKCDLSVLMRGQLSSMLLKIAVSIYWMGIIPWARNVCCSIFTSHCLTSYCLKLHYLS